MKLEWFGEQIARKVAKAAVLGVDQTMSACVTHAKAEHEWENRTGTLEGSIRIADFAAAVGVLTGASLAGGEVSGTWGSADVRYALYQEIGTSTSGPTAEQRAAAGLLGAIAPPIGPRMKARPFLRPAADSEYPTLRARIRVFYNLP